MNLFGEKSLDRRSALGVLTALVAIASSKSSAWAAPFSGTGTTIIEPGEVQWETPVGAPPNSFEQAVLVGDPEGGVGPYVVLIRWHPGFMSAPHTYLTDRMGFILSGTWWVDSAADFRPERCKPFGPGTFVQRAAGSAHYDGVIADASEPATVAMFGIAPVGLKFVDPSGPPLRLV